MEVQSYEDDRGDELMDITIGEALHAVASVLGWIIVMLWHVGLVVVGLAAVLFAVSGLLIALEWLRAKRRKQES